MRDGAGRYGGSTEGHHERCNSVDSFHDNRKDVELGGMDLVNVVEKSLNGTEENKSWKNASRE